MDFVFYSFILLSFILLGGVLFYRLIIFFKNNYSQHIASVGVVACMLSDVDLSCPDVQE